MKHASLLFLIAVLPGCTTLPQRSVTAADAAIAIIPTIPDARFWADDAQAFAATRPLLPVDTPMTMLALSGGSDNGAYGAGFITGLTRSGKRPEFAIVTGVSTGALLAPFVFLGPSYDDRITTAFTSIGPNDIYRPKVPPFALLTTSFASSKPLERMLERFITNDVIDEVAVEHNKGRRLLVGTANLDAQRGVVWNMGAIAASAAPSRYTLFRRVLLASSAVPALFPPVMIDTQSGPRLVREVHVDGATVGSLLAVPPGIVSQDNQPDRTARLYVIVNGPIEGEFKMVRGGVIPIASRAFALNLLSAVREQTVSAYLWAKANGAQFRLTYLPAGYASANKQQLFDTAFMNALFRLGAERGSQNQWQDAPPADRSR